ncbi:MAG: DUF2752 domain-containing protein [Ruminococcaceae bacterium]|nr:DUF2752 domain-containing protein [Oscillospiraceae bacterium]
MVSDRKIVLKRLLIFLVLGTAYFIWLKLTGLNIPCPVRLITGGRILCPGCGISTMFVNIIGGNFHAAFEANPCIFILLPVWLVFIGIRLIFQPKALADGQPKNQLFYYILIGILVVFGILRNIFG